jgi:hypothetical protein
MESPTPLWHCEVARQALAGLLNEYRHGNIVARSAEVKGMQRHAGSLSARWNERFPGFPIEHFPYASFRGVFYRGRRDAHLKDIIVQSLGGRGGEMTIVNPACVFGRHARQLAAGLPHVRVLAADIYPRGFQLYRAFRLGNMPENITFLKDNIFAPRLDAQPTAVVFFGACGSLSDGALDYAIASGAKWVMGRTCCHENIGGNVTITARPNPLNRLFRFKNWAYERVKKTPKYTGHYFSPDYSPSAYPRSAAGRCLSNTDEFMAVARDSVNSDICRAIIDLDRYFHLAEQGFQVELQGDLLVAEREA